MTSLRRELPRLLRRNRDFRLVFLATVVSFLGDWFAFVAVSGLVVELTGREGLAAVVYALHVLPTFAAAPFAGVIADRVDRKTLMVAVHCLAAVPALGYLVALSAGSVPLALACVAAIAVCAAFTEPLVAAIVPNIVADRDRSLAQAAIGSVWGTMLFVGAAVGGLVAATLGRQASFVLNAATFATAATLVARTRAPFRVGEAPAPASVFGHLAEVWRFVRPRRVTAALLASKSGVGLAGGIVGLLPAYALTRFGAGDAGIGLLLACRGLGALIGPFVGRAIARDRGRRLLLVCGGSAIAYATAYALLPFSGSLLLAALCVTLAHAGGGAQWVLSTYGLQVSTPDRVRGRVMSLDFGFATLAMGLSGLGAGAAAEVVGLDAASWLMAGMALAFGLAWLTWTATLWHGEREPLAAGVVDPPVQSRRGREEQPDDPAAHRPRRLRRRGPRGGGPLPRAALRRRGRPPRDDGVRRGP